MSRDARFWRNVTIIAVVHIALLVALIRWSRAPQKSIAHDITWMNAGAGDEGAIITAPAASVCGRSRAHARRRVGQTNAGTIEGRKGGRRKTYFDFGAERHPAAHVNAQTNAKRNRDADCHINTNTECDT